MKSVFLILLMAPAMSFAVENLTPNFVCKNELSSTAFFSTPVKSAEGDDSVDFKVVHYFGAANAPIFDGVVIGSDLPYLKQKSEVIKKLGDSFTVQFKKSKCEKTGDGLYSCFSNVPVTINGVQINGYNFVTRTVETKFHDFTFKTRQLIFSFIYDHIYYDMPMNFTLEECDFKN